MVFGDESSIHPKKIFSHFFIYGGYHVIDPIDVPTSFPQFGVAEINDVGHIQLWVADLQHNQRKSSTSHQLGLHKSVDSTNALELVH
jgi:hypothetical protein